MKHTFAKVLEVCQELINFKTDDSVIELHYTPQTVGYSISTPHVSLKPYEPCNKPIHHLGTNTILVKHAFLVQDLPRITLEHIEDLYQDFPAFLNPSTTCIKENT